LARGVAVVGAGGFVGARLVEMATLAGRTDVVPIVRAYRSVGRNAHLGVPHRRRIEVADLTATEY